MADGYAVPREGQAELEKVPLNLPLFPPVS